MRIRAVAVAFVLASSVVAHASVSIIEPAEEVVLRLPRTPLGVTGGTGRIKLRNNSRTDTAWLREFSPTRPLTVVASGGSLEPGQEAYWDLACTPENFDDYPHVLIEACPGPDCENNQIIFIDVDCSPGVFDLAMANDELEAYEGEPVHELLVATNPTDVPYTITEIVSRDTGALSITPLGATLPLTIEPGQSAAFMTTYDASISGNHTYLEFRDGSTVLAQKPVWLIRKSPIEVPFGGYAIPRGAAFTQPVRIRNPTAEPRTITRLGFATSTDKFRIQNRVGVTVAPGEAVEALVTYKANVVGYYVGRLEVAFDRGPGGVEDVVMNVIPRQLRVTSDGEETGWIDFGTLDLGGAITQKTFLLEDLGLGPISLPCSGTLDSGFALRTPCPVTLPREIEIQFTPDRPGVFTSSFALRLPDYTYLTLGMRAKVIDRGFRTTATKVTFPTTSIGGSTTKDLRITSFRGDAFALPVTVIGDGFSLVGESPVVIGDEGAIRIAFTPTARGKHRGVVALGGLMDPYYREIPLTGTARNNTNDEPFIAEAELASEPEPDAGCSTGPSSGGFGIALALLVVRRRRSRSNRHA